MREILKHKLKLFMKKKEKKEKHILKYKNWLHRHIRLL